MTCHSEPVRFAQGELREESAFGFGCAALSYCAPIKAMMLSTESRSF